MKCPRIIIDVISHDALSVSISDSERYRHCLGFNDPKWILPILTRIIFTTGKPKVAPI